MEELNQKLDKDTFNRFKLIQHLIKISYYTVWYI
jgi:hypothetical protein